MPSAQDCAERLREQAYRTLLPQIQDLEQELQNVGGSLSTAVHQMERKLEALRHIELPTTELILAEILEEMIRQKDLETNDLVLFSRGIRGRETQEEILTCLLDSAQKYSPRVALFAVRGDRFVGWSSRGFSQSPAKNIAAGSFSRSDCPEFQEALESENPIIVPALPENNPLGFLQEEAQGPWHLMSLRAMQRPVALLLAGGAKGTPCHPNALSILVDFTTLQLENIALKILYELAAAESDSVSKPAPPDTIETQEHIEANEVPSETPAERESPPEQAQEQPVEEEAFSQPEPEVETEPVEEPVPMPEEAPFVTLKEQSQIPATDLEEIHVAPPPPEIPNAPPLQAQPVPEEEKLHSDAKRFARLLVSEIKLYNEHHVAEGRENRDLYLRLKRDIDKSREMYEKRVSPAVSRKIDYFHDEIIRILGDNDPSTLGSDYPGPRVES
jgi:hypothetical protein